MNNMDNAKTKRLSQGLPKIMLLVCLAGIGLLSRVTQAEEESMMAGA